MPDADHPASEDVLDLPREGDDDDLYAADGMDPYDEDPDCTICGGEGYDECHDPIQCCQSHTAGDLCPCKGCGGTGLAKDQTIW